MPRAFLVLLSGAWAPAVGSLGTMGTKSSSWRSPERQNYSAVKSTILSPWRTSSAAGLSWRAQDCFNSGYSEQKRLLAPCPPLAGALAPGMGLAGAVSEPRPRPPPRIPSPQCCCSSAGAWRGWVPPGLCPGTGQCPFHPADLATSQGGCGSGFKEFESSLVCFFFFFFPLFLFLLVQCPRTAGPVLPALLCDGLLGNVCSEGRPGTEITFLFICLPCKFGGLAAWSLAWLLSADLPHPPAWHAALQGAGVGMPPPEWVGAAAGGCP